MAKKSIEHFWKQNDGKMIIGYGKWLIAYGIIEGLVTFFLLVFTVLVSSNPEAFDRLAGVMPIVIIAYALNIAMSIYCINRGSAIRKTELPPSRIYRTSTVVIIFIIVLALLWFLVNRSASTVILGILDIIVLVDSIRYRTRYHKVYSAVYNGEKNIDSKDVAKARSKSQILNNNKKETINDEVDNEYNDDTF